MSVQHTENSIKDGRLRQKGIIPPTDWGDLEQVRAVKKQEMGAECTAHIYAGVEVGGKQYSMTEHDQTELMAQVQTIKEGAAAVPYHANGELCRLYPAEEFIAIANAATAHVFYHRPYCNHLNVWIMRATVKQVDKIEYGSELPNDLAESMAALLAAASGESA